MPPVGEFEEVVGDPASAISGPAVPHAAVNLPSDAPVRRTFRDDGMQGEFDRVGFAVVPLLAPAALTELESIWADVGPAPGDERTGFFPGNASHSASWKRSVIDRVTPIVEDAVHSLLDRHHMFHVTFMTKWPGPDGKLQVHQDSTMVDREGEFRALNIWCPLNAPTAEEQHDLGAMRILPGSHRLVTADWYRARNGFIPSGLEDVEDIVYRKLAAPVVTRPGEAIAFDHRLVHCSSPNHTDRPRLVVAIGCRPAEVGNVHVECDADGWVDFYAVDDEYFIAHPRVDVTTYPHLRRVRRHPSPTVRLEDVARLAGVAPESLRPPAPEALPVSRPAPADVAAPRVVTPSPIAAAVRTLHRRAAAATVPTHRRVLRDPLFTRRLHRDGFVKVPLLTPAAAGALRERFLDLHGAPGQGFEVDIWSPDPAYRRALGEAIAEVADRPLASLFSNHRPFLRNFLVKWADDTDDGAFPKLAHRDWMYTDEPAGVKSWVVWIALEDIDHDNGQLQIARGSHRLDGALRGSNISAEWLDHEDVWSSRMLTVPVRAGEAIVLDGAVVHRSHPNLSGRPRVAVAVAVAPTGSQLVHYGRVDDDRAVRYEIDPDFFYTQQIEDLMVGSCVAPSTGVVPIGASGLSPEAVMRQLDRQPLAVLDRCETALRRVASRAAS